MAYATNTGADSLDITVEGGQIVVPPGETVEVPDDLAERLGKPFTTRKTRPPAATPRRPRADTTPTDAPTEEG